MPRTTRLPRSLHDATTGLADALRRETLGGVLLITGAAIALVWANTPWAASYTGLRDTVVGPAALHLDLSLGTWAADGLLAVFFFVVGLELKREFVTGDLRDPRRAALPIAAAVGGMAVPALLYTAVNLGRPDALAGWAVPTATDIAFALAVLAVLGRHLPAALRTFLLTLAIVDDLLAITVIALFYTAELSLLPLAAALVPLGVFGVLVQRGVGRWWLLVPLAVLTWALVHESGVHATVAAVLLAATVPVAPRTAGDGPGPVARLEHRIRPFSAGVAVPLFAFTSAGVTVGGLSGLGAALTDSVTVGIVVGLVVGKAVGISGTTWLVSRVTRARLDDALRWPDVVGLSLLGGIGFTVSLLIGELAFGAGSVGDERAKVGVLVGTLAAALLAAAVLRPRDRYHRRLAAQQARPGAPADGPQETVEEAARRRRDPSADG